MSNSKHAHESLQEERHRDEQQKAHESLQEGQSAETGEKMLGFGSGMI